MSITYNLIGSIDQESTEQLMEYLSTHPNKIKNLILNISSIGGSVYHAVTLYNFIKNLPYPVTTHNLGEVTSAAVLVYLAGTNRTAEKVSKFVVHPIKLNLNGTYSYYQLEEMLSTINGDIASYSNIVNLETNSLNGFHDINEFLRNKSIVLDYNSAAKCGFINNMCE